MRNVKWTTFFYAAFTIASLLVGGTFAVATIRGDIKLNGDREQVHYVATNHKIDSIQHDNKIEFRDIWKAIKAIDSPIVRKPVYVTERLVNGKLILIPDRIKKNY